LYFKERGDGTMLVQQTDKKGEELKLTKAAFSAKTAFSSLYCRVVSKL